MDTWNGSSLHRYASSSTCLNRKSYQSRSRLLLSAGICYLLPWAKVPYLGFFPSGKPPQRIGHFVSLNKALLSGNRIISSHPNATKAKIFLCPSCVHYIPLVMTDRWAVAISSKAVKLSFQAGKTHTSIFNLRSRSQKRVIFIHLSISRLPCYGRKHITFDSTAQMGKGSSARAQPPPQSLVHPPHPL